MFGPSELYRPSLALLTDLYELTMGYAYWKEKMVDHEAAFHLHVRANPFNNGYTVACGLAYAIDYLNHLRFDADDIDYLAQRTGNDGKPLFEKGYLDYLRDMRFTCDVHAVPEGTIVFPHEPLLRVTGPIIPAQLVESALLNIINFQSLIATKAARICLAARGETVIEFGLRRAQGVDGALSAARAAYVGGCASTSNVLAGRLFDIPVAGTHAHSWVMCFDTELESFEAYARALPNNSLFLVDTYDTLAGVKHAIEVGKRLREKGHDLVGIRLDSGDLAYLSIKARELLNAAGFTEAAIVGSSDLDEHIINSLKQEGATIAIWGVGTRLVTGYGQPAIGGVYKLSAMRSPGGEWRNRVKLSEQAVKVSTPGIQQVRRYANNGVFMADAIYNEDHPPTAPFTIVDPTTTTRHKRIEPEWRHEELLVPVIRGGKVIYDSPSLADIRARTQQQLASFHDGIKRFTNPHLYPAGLEENLHKLKMKLMLEKENGS